MPTVLSALMFFPRGGSATVARALARRLDRHGWDAVVLSGSLPGHGDAERYYGGVPVRPVLFAPHGGTPLHPSYEGAEAFASLDEDAFERHVAAWRRELQAAVDEHEPDVLHLHHLTPLNEAARRVAPGLPVVAHLHGTELLMLERIADERPPTWRHAEAWADRMRGWAQRAHTVIVPSAAQLPRVQRLLGLPRERVAVLPNGVDVALFDRVPVDRAAHWREHLHEHPRGWEPAGPEGSISYTREEAERVAANPVVLYVGRFTEVKRVGLLVEAWSAAERRFARPASLVIVGGHPGEWEGEHPADTIRRTQARDVFLAGWQPQEDLPSFLAAADLLVLPSVREQFGLVLVEAMACGVPPVAVDRYGPRDIVEPGRTGWLVEPDDARSLADALVEAVDDEAEREARGRLAHVVARERFSWDAVAERLAVVLQAARAAGVPAPGRPTVSGTSAATAGSNGAGGGRRTASRAPA